LTAYSTGIEQGEGVNTYNHLYRGKIYVERGLYELAIADFDEAIAIRPDLYEPYMRRGIILHRQGDYALAVEDFSKSLTLNPRSEDMIDLYFYRAAAYSYLDMYELAAKDYNYILSISDDPEIQALVKDYLEVIGE
jgi:tetratricopeptide (TPR) repeat protein